MSCDVMRCCACCREKDALWKKSDKLEYKQRMRAQVWAENDNVLNCPDCNAAFGFMLRKVTQLTTLQLFSVHIRILFICLLA